MLTDAWLTTVLQHSQCRLLAGTPPPARRQAAATVEGLYADQPGPLRLPLQTPLTYVLPLRLVTESNANEHWQTRYRRGKEQRQLTYYHLRCTRWPVPALPLTVHLTRIGPGLLDPDNLISSCKHCVDGIADWLAGGEGLGEDRQEGLVWQFAQERGKARVYQVRVVLTRPRTAEETA